jgi:hypothetical protein
MSMARDVVSDIADIHRQRDRQTHKDIDADAWIGGAVADGFVHPQPLRARAAHPTPISTPSAEPSPTAWIWACMLAHLDLLPQRKIG